MVKFEDIQGYGKEHFEQVSANATAFQSGVTAIANAYGEHVKKQFEETKSFAEKLSDLLIRLGRLPEVPPATAAARSHA